MFKEIEGGSKIIINDLVCWIPPVPAEYKIQGFDKPRKKQKWERTTYPDYWAKARAEEKARQEYDPKYFDPRCQAFRKQEWERRLNGHWFFNDGVPTYLTGKHYFYLNWCQLDHAENDGYPFYYDIDREDFYFTEYCFEDPKCLGYLKIGSRGTGKSSKEGAILLEEITRSPKRRKAFIQSKTEDDAIKVVFRGKIVNIYKKLPDFFKPISDSPSDPKKSLSFFRPAIRGKAAMQVEFHTEDELENSIECVASEEKTLDGETAAIVVVDEIGKCDKVDAYERHNVNRFVVYRNNKKVGMLLCTTTVEEMEKGGEACKKIFDESDPLKRDEYGVTQSGLYRYFASSVQTTRSLPDGTSLVDEYGRIDSEKSLKYQTVQRENRKNDNQSLASWVRKNPITIEEAFYVDGERCAFDSMILNQRRSELIAKPITSYGHFEWIDDTDRVRFVRALPGKTDKWELSYIPDEHQTNQVAIRYNLLKGQDELFPIATDKFCMGLDPIDHRQNTTDTKKSNAAATVFRKLDILIDDPNDIDEFGRPTDYIDNQGKTISAWKTHNFVGLYIHRPHEPTEMYEDIIMAAIYFGCEVLSESQKPGFMNWCNENGYGNFIMDRPNQTIQHRKKSQAKRASTQQGSPSTLPIIDLYTGKLKTFIRFYGHRVPFVRLIDDWLAFNPAKPTDYDPTVASGFNLIAADNVVAKKIDMATVKINIRDFVGKR